MKEIYYIECKSFYYAENSVHYQSADLGSAPILVSTFKKAVLRMEKMRETYLNLFGYNLEKNYTAEEIGVGNCYDRFSLVHPVSGIKTIVSLYKVWID